MKHVTLLIGHVLHQISNLPRAPPEDGDPTPAVAVAVNHLGAAKLLPLETDGGTAGAKADPVAEELCAGDVPAAEIRRPVEDLGAVRVRGVRVPAGLVSAAEDDAVLTVKSGALKRCVF